MHTTAKPVNHSTRCTKLPKPEIVRKEMNAKKKSFEELPENGERWS